MNRALRFGHASAVAGFVAIRVSLAAAQPSAASATPPKETAPAETTPAPAASATPPKETAAETSPATPPKEAVPVAAPAAITPPNEATAAPEPQPPKASPPKDVAAKPESAKAPPPKLNPSSLEISGAIGPSYLTGDAPANPEYTKNYSRVGLFGEIALALRSKYFLDPFLAVSYAMLAHGESELPAGPWGSGGTLDQHLSAWVVAPGITTEIWRIRLRYGLGMGFVNQSFDFLDTHNSSTQIGFAHQFGVGVNLLDLDRFRLDAEARFLDIPGADIHYPTLTVVARGDLIFFGPRQ